MEYGHTTANVKAPPSHPPQLPFKESVEVANQRLSRLLNMIDTFHQHLFPGPSSPGNSVEVAPPIDFAEMLQRTHFLIEQCENRMENIRNRF